MLALLTVLAALKAIPSVSAMLALHRVQAAPGVSDMLALLAVPAAPRNISRFSAILQSEMLRELFREFCTMRCSSSVSIREASSTQYLVYLLHFNIYLLAIFQHTASTNCYCDCSGVSTNIAAPTSRYLVPHCFYNRFLKICL